MSSHFKFRWTGLTFTSAICVAALLLSLLGFHVDAWATMPVTLRFLCGLIVFGISPGVLLLSTVLARGRQQMSMAATIISVVTCAFSCNLALNVALFTLDASFATLAYWYTVLQLLAFAAVLLLAHGDSAPSVEAAGPDPAPVSLRMLMAVLIAGGAALVYIAFVNGSPPANPEELLWLRKLVSNPVVRYDNLSYREGDPSTYFFVPFQILIAGTSVLGRIDVALTYAMFWAVTTALSLVVITELTQVMFNHRGVTAVALLWMVTVGLFDPYAVVNAIGTVTPYPNRYGFASGVLLPVTFLLFWSILRDPVTRLWRWALLVYLTVEMTFVHARETLLAVGALAAAFAVLAARPRDNWRSLARIAIFIGVTASVLTAYKYANLAIAADLGSYVSDLSRASHATLARVVEEQGFTGALFSRATAPISVTVQAGQTLDLIIPNYKHLFVDIWNNTFRGRIFMPLVLLALPLYALMATSLTELVLAVVLAGLAAVTSSAYLEYTLSGIVGNPEVFGADNLIFLFTLLVFSHGTWRLASLAVEGRSPRWKTVSLVGATIAAMAAYVYDGQVVRGVAALGAWWSPAVAWTLIALTITAVVVSLVRSSLPLFARASVIPSGATALMALLLSLVVLMPAIRRSAFWDTRPFRPAHPSYSFTGDLLQDYDRLGASNKLDSTAYPIEVVRFLTHDVPPNQTIMAADVLTLLERVPHFTPVVSNRAVVATSFIVNWHYLRTYSRSDINFRLQPFVESEEGRSSLAAMLADYAVDYLIVGPDEGPAIAASRDQYPGMQSLLEPAFTHGGFTIYRVHATP